MNGSSTLSGRLAIRLLRAPRPSIFWQLANLPNLWRGWWKHQVALCLGIGHFYGELRLLVRKGDGTVINYGLVSTRVVTTAGVTEVCTRFAGTSAASIANFKYHAFGTGTGVEATANTALGTELTTEYAGDVRPTGNQSASGTTYVTVATLTPDSGGVLAITEHGILAASTVGTLLDRSKFAAVNLDSSAGDSLVATYTLSLPAGS